MNIIEIIICGFIIALIIDVIWNCISNIIKDKKLRKFFFDCSNSSQMRWYKIASKIIETLGLTRCDECGGFFPKDKIKQVIVEKKYHSEHGGVVPISYLYCPHCAPKWDKKDIDGNLYKKGEGWIKIEKKK